MFESLFWCSLVGCSSIMTDIPVGVSSTCQVYVYKKTSNLKNTKKNPFELRELLIFHLISLPFHT